MKIQELVNTYSTKEAGALVGEIALDFTVYTSGSFFDEEVQAGVLDFYRQARERFGAQWAWIESDQSTGPRRADARALETFLTWFSPAARRREQYVLQLRSGEKTDDIGTTAFECGAFGKGNLPGYLRLTLPVDFVSAGAKEYADLCAALVEKLPMWCGRAGYSLRWNEYSRDHYRKGLARAQWIADWYPGVDLPDDGMLILDDSMRGKLPNLNWITLLGPELLEAVGGIDSLRGSLPPPVVLRELTQGLLIQAGPAPEPGNSPKPDEMAGYRAVAQALKPLRPSSYPPLVKDPAAWLARFD